MYWICTFCERIRHIISWWRGIWWLFLRVLKFFVFFHWHHILFLSSRVVLLHYTCMYFEILFCRILRALFEFFVVSFDSQIITPKNALSKCMRTCQWRRLNTPGRTWNLCTLRINCLVRCWWIQTKVQLWKWKNAVEKEAGIKTSLSFGTVVIQNVFYWKIFLWFHFIIKR